MSKTVALVLGSGGARGYAHIGVLDALHERGYQVIGLSGCSMGAIVGAFYCAGKLEDYRRWVSGLKYLDVLKLVDLSLLTSGVIRGDRVFNILADMLGELRIEELDIPFTAVATDMTHKKEIWFQSGSLQTAIRASAAIPSIFHPVHSNGRMLVDGGVLNPLPISPCVSIHADCLIAVDVNADVPLPKDFVPQPAEAIEPGSKDKQAWLDGLVQKASNWFEGKKPEQEMRRNMGENLGKFEMINQMFETMQLSLTRFKTAAHPPDLLINVPIESAEMYEFYHAQSLIDLGYRIGCEALDTYEQGGSSPYGMRLS